MKHLVLKNIMLIIMLVGLNQAFSQCTPGNEESCPDPEGNGQMCPEVLNPAYIGVPYLQEVTILAPVQLDTLDLQIPVHHLTLINVENLPEGIGWQSNADMNEFMAGIYYCMSLTGTTDAQPAVYPLKIVIDVYANVLGQPVKVARLTDSTTLSIQVEWNPNSIKEQTGGTLASRIWPIPASDFLNIETRNSISGTVDIEIYNALGVVVQRESFETTKGNTFLTMNLQSLTGGFYMMSLKNKGKRQTRMIVVERK